MKLYHVCSWADSRTRDKVTAVELRVGITSWEALVDIGCQLGRAVEFSPSFTE